MSTDIYTSFIFDTYQHPPEKHKSSIENFLHRCVSGEQYNRQINNPLPHKLDSPTIRLPQYVDASTRPTYGTFEHYSCHRLSYKQQLTDMVEKSQRLTEFFSYYEGKDVENSAVEEYVKRVILSVVCPNYDSKSQDQVRLRGKCKTIRYEHEALWRLFVYKLLGTVFTALALKDASNKKNQMDFIVETKHIGKVMSPEKVIEFMKGLFIADNVICPPNVPGEKETCTFCQGTATVKGKQKYEFVISSKKYSLHKESYNDTGDLVLNFVLCSRDNEIGKALYNLILFEKRMELVEIPAVIENMQKQGKAPVVNNIVNEMVKSHSRSLKKSVKDIMKGLGSYMHCTISDEWAMQLMGKMLPYRINASEPEDPRFDFLGIKPKEFVTMH